MKQEFLKNWDTQMKKGLLPLFVLQLLQTKECYGYEIIQELKSVFSIDVNEGTIYPLLIRLMKEGLLQHQWVEQASGIPRKYYTISSEGKTVYAEMKNNIESNMQNLK
jgi:PadR family transcriptional regulator PadR